MCCVPDVPDVWEVFTNNFYFYYLVPDTSDMQLWDDVFRAEADGGPPVMVENCFWGAQTDMQLWDAGFKADGGPPVMEENYALRADRGVVPLDLLPHLRRRPRLLGLP